MLRVLMGTQRGLVRLGLEKLFVDALGSAGPVNCPHLSQARAQSKLLIDSIAALAHRG